MLNNFERMLAIVTILLNCFWHVISPPPLQMQPTEQYDREYWYTQAQLTLERRLQLLKHDRSVAKNIIIFIGDGMSIATTTAARILRGQRRGQNGEDNELAWDLFPAVALAKTYNVDAQTGESSACATALFCGAKTNYETLGLDATARFNNCNTAQNAVLSSIFDWAHHAGKWSGIVTTSRVTHATPAALYAHSPSRYWEDDSRVPPKARVQCQDIALQLLESEPGKSIKVILGGGRRHFLPLQSRDPKHATRDGRRLDGRNLAQEWLRGKRKREERAALVNTKTELDKLNLNQIDYLLGLFEYSHMEFEYDRLTSGSDEPSLADMTRSALSILTRAEQGFVLVVEGGRIDHAHHFNNPFRALDDTLALESSVIAALERVDADETIVIVTADHGHVMTIGGQATPRGHPILGAEPSVSDMDGLPYSTLLYGSGPGHAEPRVTPLVNLTLPVNQQYVEDADAVHAAAAPRHWATHGGEDVPVYAKGPMATVLFGGTIEQSYIPHALSYAACIGRYTSRCRQVAQNNTSEAPPCPHKETPNNQDGSGYDASRASKPSKMNEASGASIASRSAESARPVLVASSVRSDDRNDKSSSSLNCFCSLIYFLSIILFVIK